MQRRALVAAALIGLSWLGAGSARADFCLQLADGFPGSPYAFFRFTGKHSTKPGKLTALVGKVALLEMGTVAGLGPAFGSALGLPEGDAGAKLGVQFVDASLIAFASLVLDDNGGTSGAGSVSLAAGGSFSDEASIADCATEPKP